MMSITKLTCLAVVFVLQPLFFGAAAEPEPTANPLHRETISIPSLGTTITGHAYSFLVPELPSERGLKQHVKVVLLPAQEIVWSGTQEEANLVFVEGMLLGFGQNRVSPEMRTIASTNHFDTNAGLSAMLEAEVASFISGAKTNFFAERYIVQLDKLLHHERGLVPRIRVAGSEEFSTNRLASNIVALEVLGTNVVVTSRYSEQVLVKIAFDTRMHPVWAATNGVSIGPVPTNCVFHFEAISNRIVTTVVY